METETESNGFLTTVIPIMSIGSVSTKNCEGEWIRYSPSASLKGGIHPDIISETSFSDRYGQFQNEYIIYNRDGEVVVEMRKDVSTILIKDISMKHIQVAKYQYSNLKIVLSSITKECEDKQSYKEENKEYHKSKIEYDSVTILSADIDLTAKEKIKLFRDGKPIKFTKKDFKQLCTYVRKDICDAYVKIGIPGIKEMTQWQYNSNTIFKGGWSLYNSVLAFLRYPALETIREQSEHFFAGIAGGTNRFPELALQKQATSPAKLLGISNIEYKEMIKLDKQNISCRLDCETMLAICIQDSKTERPNPNLINKWLPLVYSCKLNSDDVKSLMELNYQPDQLSDYLINEISTFQGILYPDEGVRLLLDYIDMQQKMHADYIRYPRSLKLAHDLASRNYTIHIDEVQAEQFTNVVSKPDYKRLAWKGNKYSFIIPQSGEDLIREGSSLNHCVGSYVDRVANSQTKIVFLRLNSAPEKSYITIEVRGDKTFDDREYIKQVHGKGDRNATEDEVKIISQWAKIKGISYDAKKAILSLSKRQRAC